MKIAQSGKRWRRTRAKAGLPADARPNSISAAARVADNGSRRSARDGYPAHVLFTPGGGPPSRGLPAEARPNAVRAKAGAGYGDRTRVRGLGSLPNTPNAKVD